MTGTRPDPTVRGGRGEWIVDLRSHGFGQRVPLGPAVGPEAIDREEALYRAFAKLEELRAARLAGPNAQLELSAGAPSTFAGAMDAWERQKRYATDGGRDWGKQYAAQVRSELGAFALERFGGIEGGDQLSGYLAGLQVGARAVRNRFSVIGQVLRHAAARRWLPGGMPVYPDLPSVPAPKYSWADESSFRAMRAQVGFRTVEPADGETRTQWAERRRCFLSWLFYTGAHPRDAEMAEDRHVAVDIGVYLRHNNKSAASVPDEHFEMPAPLQQDLRRLLAILGREAFFCGELIFGGPWVTHNKVMEHARRKAGIPGGAWNARLLRRSFAREMLVLGYTVPEVSARMGHADERMVKEVYTRLPRAAGVARSKWTAKAPSLDPRRRVLAFKGSVDEG